MYYLYGQVISDGKIYKDQYVEIKDGVIRYVGDIKRNDWHVYQVECGYICPGLVDIHIHAVDGFDFTDEDGEVFSEIAKRLPKYGVTSFLATSRTLSKAGLTRFLHSADSYLEEENSSRMLGTHIEGPWISNKYKGAQPEEYIRRLTWGDVKEVIKPYKRVVQKITIAPEEVGEYAILSYLNRLGITLSAGHTNATLDDIGRAIEFGLNQITHTFNAMSPVHHREPGAAAAALYYPRLICEVIPDGVHVHSKIIELLYRIKGKEKVALISDCTGYNNLDDGEYFIRNKQLIKKDNEVTLTSGNLAGSSQTLDKGVQYAVKECNIPIEEAIYMATRTPLEALNIEEKLGRISTGYKADIVILNDELAVEKTIINGELVYERCVEDGD